MRMGEEHDKARRRVFRALFIVVASATAALLYTLFALLGRAPMSWPIHLGMTTTLALINALFLLLFSRASQSFPLRVQLAVLLWGGAALWYWGFAPFYAFFTSTSDLLLVSLSAFEFVWEVPFFAAAFITLCLWKFRSIARFVEGRTPSPGDATALFIATLRFPLYVGLLAFLITFLGYFVAFLQSSLWGAQPWLEGSKTLVTGFAISFFLADFYVLTIDRLLGTVRGRLEERYAVPRRAQRRFSLRALWMFLGVTGASISLLVPLGLQGFQVFMRETLVEEARTTLSRVAPETQNIQSEAALNDLLKEVRLELRGQIEIVASEEALSSQNIAPTTRQVIEEERDGVLTDFFREEKVIAFFSVPALDRKVMVTMRVLDRYTAWPWLVWPLIVGGLSILGASIVNSIFITSDVGRATRILMSGVERARAGGKEIIPDVNTGDEFEDLAHAMRYFVAETRTARRQLEAEIVATERERGTLAGVVRSMGEAVLLIDRDERVRLVNPVAAELLGVRADEAVGVALHTLVTLRQNSQVLSGPERPIIRSLTGGEVVVVGMGDNVELETSAGRRIPIGLVTSPLREHDEITGAVAVFRDLTQEEQLEAARTNFISVASHQLRTPLTSMRWFSEMLLAGQAGKLVVKQRRFVQFVYQSTLRMANLVNLLLQSARVEAGRVQLNPQPMDLKDFTKEIAQTFGAMMKEKLQILEIVASPDPLPKIPMDREILWQVIANLLSNAIRYSPAKAKILVTITQRGDAVEYAVKDSGIGIPKEYQDRIFERFFRAPNALRIVPDGSGLGLSLARAIVKGWGGDLWFRSEEGKGTTFSYTIPLRGMAAAKGEIRLSA